MSAALWRRRYATAQAHSREDKFAVLSIPRHGGASKSPRWEDNKVVPAFVTSACRTHWATGNDLFARLPDLLKPGKVQGEFIKTPF